MDGKTFYDLRPTLLQANSHFGEKFIRADVTIAFVVPSPSESRLDSRLELEQSLAIIGRRGHVELLA